MVELEDAHFAGPVPCVFLVSLVYSSCIRIESRLANQAVRTKVNG